MPSTVIALSEQAEKVGLDLIDAPVSGGPEKASRGIIITVLIGGEHSHTLAGTPALYEVFSKDVKAAALAAGQRGVVLPIAASIGAMMAEGQGSAPGGSRTDRPNCAMLDMQPGTGSSLSGRRSAPGMRF